MINLAFTQSKGLYPPYEFHPPLSPMKAITCYVLCIITSSSLCNTYIDWPKLSVMNYHKSHCSFLLESSKTFLITRDQCPIIMHNLRSTVIVPFSNQFSLWLHEWYHRFLLHNLFLSSTDQTKCSLFMYYAWLTSWT